MKSHLSNEGRPIVDHESSADDVRASVDGSGNERNLEKRRELVEVGR